MGFDLGVFYAVVVGVFWVLYGLYYCYIRRLSGILVCVAQVLSLFLVLYFGVGKYSFCSVVLFDVEFVFQILA
jgi:hypothetical protein